MTMTVNYYRMKKVTLDRQLGTIVTAAFITCGICSEPIDSMGGPDPDAICNDCCTEIRNSMMRELFSRYRNEKRDLSAP